jgi:hypothetical protein
MEMYPLKPNRDGHIGFAMIINNYAFKPKPRLGSDVDVRDITASLAKLGFFVDKACLDLTADQMKEKMEWYADKTYQNYSCFACVIMSHGDNQSKIYGVDNETVHLIDDLIEPFKECTSLGGKPKLFFVNASRGQSRTSLIDEADTMRARDETDGTVLARPIPKEADILIHFATVENNVSMINPTMSSYFIQSLCFVLENHAKGNEDIGALLRMVNNRVATEYNKNMPEIYDRLRCQLFFNLNRTINLILQSSSR